MTYKSIYIHFVIVISFFVYSYQSQAKKRRPRISHHYVINAKNDGPFKSCQKENKESKPFYLSCIDNSITEINQIENLYSDQKKISKRILINPILQNLQSFTLKKLKDGYDEVEGIQRCFKENCPIKDQILKETKKKIARLRITMALKDRTSFRGQFEFGEKNNFNTDISHNIITLLPKKLAPIDNSEKKNIIKEISNYKKTIESKWAQNEIKKSPECFDLFFTIKDKCKELKLKRSRETFNTYNRDVTAKYEKEYHQLISQNPLLLFLDKIKKDAKLEKDILSGLEQIKTSYKKNIKRIKNLKNHDQLVLFENLTNEFIKQDKDLPYKCSLLTEVYEKQKTEETAKDIAIDLGLIGTGFFCNSTGRVICPIITGLTGEAIGIAIIQNKVEKSQLNLETKIQTSDEIESLTNERNLSILAAPMVGLELNQVVKASKSKKLISHDGNILDLQRKIILDAFDEEQPVNLRMEGDKLKRLKIIHNNTVNDYKLVVENRMGLAPRGPDPIVSIEGIPFFEEKTFVHEHMRKNPNFDQIRNFSFSAESKHINHLINPLDNTQFNPQQIKLMTMGVKKYRDPPDGVSENYLLTLNDNSMGYFKAYNNVWLTNPRAEITAYELSEKFGFGLVPTTVLKKVNEKTGSFQVHIKNKGSKKAEVNKYFEFSDEEKGKLNLFDFLIDARDRNNGNILRGLSDEIIAIDNSLSFTGRGTNYVDFSLRKRTIKIFLKTSIGREIIENLRNSLFDANFLPQMVERLGEEDANRLQNRIQFLVDYYDQKIK